MKISVLLISLFAVFASLEVALSLEADGLCTVAAIMNNDHESECSVVHCQQSCEEIGPLLGRCNRVSDDKSKCHCYASCFALAADSDAHLSSVADVPAPLADSSSDALFNEEYAEAPSPDDSDIEAPLPSFNEEYNAEAPLADSDAPLSSFEEYNADAPSPDSDMETPLPSFNEEYNSEAPLQDIEWDGAPAPSIWI